MKFYLKVMFSGVSSYAVTTSSSQAAGLFVGENNVQFLTAFIIFIVITLLLVFWLVLDRKNISKKLDRYHTNSNYLKRIISQRQDSFYLWNDKKELVLNSLIDIHFEDEKAPNSIGELTNRFSLGDQIQFETNLETLLSSGKTFSQTIDLNKYNMHLSISGNVIELGGYCNKCYVVWLKDSTIEEKVQRYQALESKETTERANLLEKALNKAKFPIWIRKDNLDLEWVNKAYVDVVDGGNCKNVIENNIELSTNSVGVNLRSMAKKVNLSSEAHAESHYIVINGQRRSMDFHNIPYEVDDNKDAILGYAQDMTELEEAKGNLADHTESYAETLDKFSTAVAIFDKKMHLEYYNKAYLRLWDLPESLLFSHPHYGEILEALREARKLPEQANFPQWKKKQLAAYKELNDPVESMLHLPDGKTLRVVMQHHPLGGMLMFYEDVTDYFALESSYNTLIAVQRETLDNLHEGIAVFGVDGRLKLFNDGFINIWGVSEDFLNKDPHAFDVLNRCGELFDAYDEMENLKTLIVGGEAKKEASAGQFKLKNDKVINYSLVPLPDGAVLVIFIDVTDSYRVEYSLRKHNEALEEAQKIKTDFLAHMSYELRNPLNSVLGFAELLEKEYQGPLNDSQHQYMRNILSASDYLLELINDILDLSLIEAGGLSIVATEYDIQELISGVVLKIEERVKSKSINLEVDFDPTLVNVQGDPKRIQHSVSNLLSNAVKFTMDSGNISVKTWQDTDNYFISVSDDGVGIEPNEVDDVFDKFYTGSNVPKGKGTGLGLSLVKIFIEKHGGEIIVESTIGIGTKITCKLPKDPPNLEALPDQDNNFNDVSQLPLC